MRKTIAIVSAAGALLFGAAGIASAETQGTTAASQSTTLADNTSGDMHHDSDDNGKWGMFGLLGLFGLAGLKRRNTTDVAVGAGPSGARGHA
jgi:MYXO-CTERM domain-containing protein